MMEAVEVDIERARREEARWRIMIILNSGRPIGASESLIFSILDDLKMLRTPQNIRRELDYLRDKNLVELETGNVWQAKLTAHGIDVVEYTVSCPAGIARPEKWW